MNPVPLAPFATLSVRTVAEVPSSLTSTMFSAAVRTSLAYDVVPPILVYVAVPYIALESTMLSPEMLYVNCANMVYGYV